MKFLVGLLTLVLLTGCSMRQLQVISTGLLIADWRQTLQIAQQPDKYWENNPLLGKHPSEDRVNFYFGSVVVGNILVGEYVPRKYAKWYYYTCIVVESVVVKQNMSIGLMF